MKAIKINGYEFNKGQIFTGDKSESKSVQGLWSQMEADKSIVSMEWNGVTVEAVRS